MRTSIAGGCSLLAIAAGLACGPAFAAPGAAASNRDTVEELIVTAQRRAENIQDVPISMTAVSGESLVKSGVVTVEGLQRLAPGLSISAVGSGFVSYTYIRGGGTNQVDPGSEPSVAYFVDEIYQGGTEGLQFDLFDVDHIEVLKGPQGTLFGRNAASGAISIVTRRPSARFGGDVDVEYGNYNSLLARGGATGPITSDGSLRFRLSGVVRQRDGFTKNLFPGGSDPGSVDSRGARGQLEWVGEDVTVLVAADVLRTRNGQTNQFIDTVAVAGAVDPTLPQPTDQSFFAHYYNDAGHEDQMMSDASTRIEWTTPLGVVTSITAGRLNKFDRVQDNDATIYFATLQHYNEKDRTFSQELRLAGDAAQRLHYVGGLYYYHQDTDFFFSSLSGPANPTAATRGKIGTDISTIETNSYAVFGQGKLDLTRELSLTIGGRYTEDQKKEARTVNRFGAIYSVAPNATFHAFTPAVTLEYKPTEDIMGYVSWRKGFKSGGFQTLAPPSATVAATPFLPEKVTSYELGLKSTFFDRRLLFNVAVFRSDISNQQVSRQVPPPIAVVLIDNAGRTRDDGVDLTLVGKPLPGLTLTASATLQHARFRSYQSGALDFSGKSQLRSPDFQGYFAGEYERPLSDLGDLDLLIEHSRKSKVFFDAANSSGAGLFAPAYGVTNLRASLRFAHKPLELGIFVKNVADKHYFQNINVIGTTGIAAPAEPRTYGVSLQYHF